MHQKKSKGIVVKEDFLELKIEEFSIENVSSCDVVFLCVSGEFSLKYAEKLTKKILM